MMNRIKHAALLGLTCSLACCAAQQTAPTSSPPASRIEGQRELEELTVEIERNRVALGLPERREVGSAGEMPSEALRPQPADAADQAAPSAPMPGQAAPSQAPELESAPETNAKASAMEEPREGYAHQRAAEQCPEPCRYTKAICHAAGRICDIARYLDEEDARRRCDRARQDCSEAQRATAERCESCK
jgi:hypothetical protein